MSPTVRRNTAFFPASLAYRGQVYHRAYAVLVIRDSQTPMAKDQHV